ncbi:MAG TPA: helix-turn-helix transcriptional regulator [Rhizomicrobium sp.]|nr:helix-turn-helix transcriptional regulator [Rhizomicrobium sp.]
MTISARQIRAARKLLGWTQRELARKANLSIGAIGRIERGEAPAQRDRVEKALSAADIKFIPNDGRKGEGVRFAKPMR